jgi:hypothetical protein
MKWGKGLPSGPSDGNGVHLCFNRHSGFGGNAELGRSKSRKPNLEWTNWTLGLGSRTAAFLAP